MTRRAVVVIGGGITGLTAALTLKQQFEPSEIDCTLLEQSRQVGGQIRTHREDNLILEFGPNEIVDTNHCATNLIRDLGVSSEIVYPSAHERLYLFKHGQLVPCPADPVLGVPMDFRSAWASPLVHTAGKFRILADYLLPPSSAQRAGEDESLGGFLRRRLGDPWVTGICEPLLESRFGTNIDNLSLQSVVPDLVELSKNQHRLLWGGHEAWAARRSAGHRQPEVFTLRGGLQTLTERLFDGLRGFAEVRNGAAVTKIERLGNRQYTITFETNGTEQHLLADTILLSTPAPISGQLLCGLSAKAAKLSAVRYRSATTVILGYPFEHLEHFPGTGIVVPHDEPGCISACSFTSRRYPHTTTDYVLVRCDLRRTKSHNSVGLDDAAITGEVTTQLRHMLELSAKPWFTKVVRFDKAIPEYEVGHPGLIEEVESALRSDVPGVYIAGSGCHGYSVSACIKSGRNAANAAVRAMRTSTSTSTF